MGFWKKLFGRKQETRSAHLQVKVIDFRSEEEKKIEEERARRRREIKEKDNKIREEGIIGIGVDLKETDTLIQLMAEAHDSGRRSGFGLYKDYPQYEEVRSIGERIHGKGGFEAMQRSYYYIRVRNPILGSMLDGFWDGIGEWRR